MNDLVAINLIDPMQIHIVQAEAHVDKIKNDVKKAVKRIKSEDSERELYSLNPCTKKVQLPTFGGCDDEDFVVFRKQFEKAVFKNRVAKADKLGKLREALFGHAKKLIPSLFCGSLDDAWAILDKSFGDSTRLMRYKKESLLRLGHLSKLTKEISFKAQVFWYLDVEHLLKDIIELGSRSERLYREAFCESTIRNIYRMFPIQLMNKLLKCEGDGQEKVESILNKISQLRSRAQEVLTLVETDGAPSHWLEDDSDVFEVGETETAQENCVTKKVAGRTKVLRYNSDSITKSTAAFQLRKLRKEIYGKL